MKSRPQILSIQTILNAELEVKRNQPENNLFELESQLFIKRLRALIDLSQRDVNFDFGRFKQLLESRARIFRGPHQSAMPITAASNIAYNIIADAAQLAGENTLKFSRSLYPESKNSKEKPSTEILLQNIKKHIENVCFKDKDMLIDAIVDERFYQLFKQNGLLPGAEQALRTMLLAGKTYQQAITDEQLHTNENSSRLILRAFARLELADLDSRPAYKPFGSFGGAVVGVTTRVATMGLLSGTYRAGQKSSNLLPLIEFLDSNKPLNQVDAFLQEKKVDMAILNEKGSKSAALYAQVKAVGIKFAPQDEQIAEVVNKLAS